MKRDQDLTAILIALLLPFGIGIAALVPLALHSASATWLGTVPSWVQAIGVPLALFGAIHAAQLPIRASERKEALRQRALTQLAAQYADELLAVYTEAEAALVPGRPGNRLGRERFDLLMEELRRFPRDQLDDPDVTLAVYGLSNSLAFYIPRYNNLAAFPHGPRSGEFRQKMAGCRAAAIEGRRLLLEKLELMPTR